ncbi:hypothetical protein Tco_0916033 [Tanacetum coccineum]
MAAFKVLETQFQMFIKSRIYLDDEYVIMTRNTALDASLVNIESSGKESGEQDTSSKSGDDADTDDADIKPVYDEELMAEVQLTVECNVFATGQQHIEKPEFNNKGEVDQNAE